MPWKGGKVAPPPIEIELAGIVTCIKGSPLNVFVLPASAFVLAVKLTVARELQLRKALLPMEVTDVGIVTEVREVQLPKACCPIEVTDEGIVTEVRELQPKKAVCPMDVTDEGIITDDRELQL